MKNLLLPLILVLLPSASFAQCANSWTCNFTVTQTSPSSVTITWNSVIAASTQLRYGKTPSYGTKTVNQPALTLTHSVSLTKLLANTIYYYEGIDADALSVSIFSAPLQFTLTSQTGSHVVNLNWNASTSPNIAGYNMYRSVDQVTWTISNGSLIASTSYTDSAVTNGQSYYYRATAVDTSNSESSPSNIASVVIPQ